MLTKYYHTLRHLRPIQFRYRLYYALRRRWRRITGHRYADFPTYPDFRPKALVVEIAYAPKTYEGYNTFRFLNLKHAFPTDIDWNTSSHGKLWTYNLNYFEYLNQYGLTKDEGLRLIKDFVGQLEQVRDGLEPYPVALRAMNWMKFFMRRELGKEEDRLQRCLYGHLRRLYDNLEYHLLGNHLLEDAFALFMGGVYFEDEALLKVAQPLLQNELYEQILGDGGHFERSPMYHQLMLNRLLDVINLLQSNPRAPGQDLLPGLRETASHMLGWSQNILLPDGALPRVNDSTDGIAPPPAELFAYAGRLEIPTSLPVLSDSGYRKLEGRHFTLFADAGSIGPDYIPGHAHSDTLSFILYVKNQPWLVDPGISTYEKNARRRWERSTAAHNTVQLDGWEQSEVWGGFRVARRAYPAIEREDKNELIASHDGYARKGFTHRRSFRMDEEVIRIQDEVLGKGPVTATAYFHFHPEVEVALKGTEVVTNLGRLRLKGQKSVRLERYEYAEGYNLLREAGRVVVEFGQELGVSIGVGGR